jgi:hypothetical protein
VTTVPTEVRCVKIPGFHRYLSFWPKDGSIAAREKSDDGSIPFTLFSAKVRSKAVSYKLKTSTYRVEECDTFEQELTCELQRLKSRYG